MSHSQFHSIKLFILRHAWLNLWDKHMTTGRINQVTLVKRNKNRQRPKSLSFSPFFFVTTSSTSWTRGSEEVLLGDRLTFYRKPYCNNIQSKPRNWIPCSDHYLRNILLPVFIFFPELEHWKINFSKPNPWWKIQSSSYIRTDEY
jgi:hypothetical protein